MTPAQGWHVKLTRTKNRRYCISELWGVRTQHPGGGRAGGTAGVQLSGQRGEQGPQRQCPSDTGTCPLLCWFSLLGMPEAGLHRTCKTSVEKQMRGKWSKPTNISTGTLAGGLQPLSPPIPLRCICLQPPQGLGCSRWMETEAGAVQSAGRA